MNIVIIFMCCFLSYCNYLYEKLSMFLKRTLTYSFAFFLFIAHLRGGPQFATIRHWARSSAKRFPLVVDHLRSPLTLNNHLVHVLPR